MTNQPEYCIPSAKERYIGGSILTLLIAFFALATSMISASHIGDISSVAKQSMSPIFTASALYGMYWFGCVGVPIVASIGLFMIWKYTILARKES